jgi:hypothetical protein
MKRLQHFVNLLFSRFTLHLHVLFREGQNYNLRNTSWQETFPQHVLCPVSCSLSHSHGAKQPPSLQ